MRRSERVVEEGGGQKVKGSCWQAVVSPKVSREEPCRKQTSEHLCREDMRHRLG